MIRSGRLLNSLECVGPRILSFGLRGRHVWATGSRRGALVCYNQPFAGLACGGPWRKKRGSPLAPQCVRRYIRTIVHVQSECSVCVHSVRTTRQEQDSDQC